MKKEYKKPTLQNLGKMRIVTQGTSSGPSDPGGNQNGGKIM